jgi:hypothetical protein
MAVGESVLCTQAEKMDQIIEGERKMSMAIEMTRQSGGRYEQKDIGSL